MTAGRRRIAFLTAVGVLALACGCARRLPRGTPVVLISIDTLRADHLPAYGYRGVETPSLDSLRRESVLFENAYSQVPLTLPSHAVILTGLFPYQNGVRDNIGFRLANGTPTLASILRQAGYATGAAVSSLALHSDRGLDYGFDLYDDRFSSDSPDERAGPESVAVLVKWLDTVKGRPLFAFLHLYEPHTPYAPPEPFRSRYREHPYDGEIAAADAAVGGLLNDLKRRGIYDRALIVFLSDHGEGLGDHGEDEHGVFLYREAIRVPLWIKLPGSRRRGESVVGPVGLVDVAPTLVAALGLRTEAKLPGRDLLSKSSSEGARRIYSETLYPRLALGWSELTSLVDERFHYIQAPRSELYDVASDPSEHRDLSSTKPDDLRARRQELARTPRDAASPSHATAEEVEKLGSLGYISVSRGSTGRQLPDPKDRVSQLKKYKALFALHYAHEDARAIAAAREILAEDPQIASVWRMLAKSRERLGDLAGAAHDLADGLSKCPDAPGEERSQMLEQEAAVLLRADRKAEAERVLRAGLASPAATDSMKLALASLLTETGRATEALTLFPANGARDAATLDARGVALAEAGRLEEAKSSFLEGLSKNPDGAALELHMGMLALRQGNPAEARDWFDKSLRTQPDAPGTLSARGLAQVQLHDEAGAFESWSKATQLDPTQYDSLLNLAIVAGRMGRRQDARRALERFIATAPKTRYPAQIGEARRLLRSLGPPG